SATSLPCPARPLVASSSENLPLTGSPSLTGTCATGFAATLRAVGAGGGGGSAVFAAVAVCVAAAAVLTGSTALRESGSGGAPDWQALATSVRSEIGTTERFAFGVMRGGYYELTRRRVKCRS